jgi:hypothetical protein
MCTVLLPPDDNPVTVNKYIILSSNQTLIPPCCRMSNGLADFLSNTTHFIFLKRFKIAPLDARLGALLRFLSLHFVARKCRRHLQTCITGAVL